MVGFQGKAPWGEGRLSDTPHMRGGSYPPGGMNTSQSSRGSRRVPPRWSGLIDLARTILTPAGRWVACRDVDQVREVCVHPGSGTPPEPGTTPPQ